MSEQSNKPKRARGRPKKVIPPLIPKKQRFWTEKKVNF